MILAGCGGTSSGFDPFVGTWSGSYQIRNPGGSVESSGLLTLVIDDIGRVTGSMQRTDSNFETVPVRQGSLSGDDSLQYFFNYSNTSDREVRGFVRIDGNLFVPDDQLLTVFFAGGTSGTMNVSLTRS